MKLDYEEENGINIKNIQGKGYFKVVSVKERILGKDDFKRMNVREGEKEIIFR